MFRLWGKLIKNNHIIQDFVVCNDDNFMNRTRKIYAALDTLCYEFDLSKPIWFEYTINDFKKHDKTRFTKDNFIDSINFDYLEIQVIEDD